MLARFFAVASLMGLAVATLVLRDSCINDRHAMCCADYTPVENDNDTLDGYECTRAPDNEKCDTGFYLACCTSYDEGSGDASDCT
ncbi:hypothetical protein M405DRAFT_939117 [Rhizopogon salebrosus TDB-379]|nr:hypothetical protein M405DRAFT_939117 [Rhizopogon salebrosus TDB-379]